MKLILLAFITLLQNPSAEHANIKDGLAVNGYDIVSYFQGEPLKGNKSISAEYNGITYRFNSEANRQQFTDAPEKFVPAYGGWCAYAMGATGEKVKVDPETFKIINDRLYLFYNFWGNNTLESWNENEITLKPKADKYWDEILASNK